MWEFELSGGVCSLGPTVVNDLPVSFKVSHAHGEMLPGMLPDVNAPVMGGVGCPAAWGWALPAVYFPVKLSCFLMASTVVSQTHHH